MDAHSTRPPAAVNEPRNPAAEPGSRGLGFGQTFVANFDSAVACHLFLGFVGDTSHRYDVDIYEYPNGANWIARKHDVKAHGDHRWLEFTLEPHVGYEFVRGRAYIAKSTRPGDSIHSYVSHDDPHPCGEIPDDIVPNNADLVARVAGCLDPLDSLLCGMEAGFAGWSDTEGAAA